MKMVLVALMLFLSGCGAAQQDRWEALPVTVTVTGSAQLESATAGAVAMLNAGLGSEVFTIGEGGPISISYGQPTEGCCGSAHTIWTEWITECSVVIEELSTCAEGSLGVKVVAHELFHCLGFNGHSENSGSLMTGLPISIDAEVDEEMLAMFSDKYPEVVQ